MTNYGMKMGKAIAIGTMLLYAGCDNSQNNQNIENKIGYDKQINFEQKKDNTYGKNNAEDFFKKYHTNLQNKIDEQNKQNKTIENQINNFDQIKTLNNDFSNTTENICGNIKERQKGMNQFIYGTAENNQDNLNYKKSNFYDLIKEEL